MTIVIQLARSPLTPMGANLSDFYAEYFNYDF